MRRLCHSKRPSPGEKLLPRDLDGDERRALEKEKQTKDALIGVKDELLHELTPCILRNGSS